MVWGYTLEEAARLLGVTVGRIRQLKTQGKLTPILCGRKVYLIDPRSLHLYDVSRKREREPA